MAVIAKLGALAHVRLNELYCLLSDLCRSGFRDLGFDEIERLGGGKQTSAGCRRWGKRALAARRLAS